MSQLVAVHVALFNHMTLSALRPAQRSLDFCGDDARLSETFLTTLAITTIHSFYPYQHAYQHHDQDRITNP
jgi:hypothetical protein